MAVNIQVKLQVKTDTPANWASLNPVLSQGEMGFDGTDFKIGDEVTPWNSLAYWTPSTIKGASKLLPIGNQGWGIPPVANAASTAGTSEMMDTVGVTSTGISALWTHWYTTAGVDTDPGGSITFSASLRVVSTTNPGTQVNKIYRFTFNGRTSATLDPGGQVKADILGVTLAAGDVVAVRTYLASGTAYAPRFTYGGSWGGFTSTTDLTAPGSAAITGSAGYYYGPAVLLGHAEGAANAKSVLLAGDSIAASGGDNASETIPALGQGGFVMRAITGVAGLLNLGVSGDISNNFQNSDYSLCRQSIAQVCGCTSAIGEYGTNDFNGGATAATVEAIDLNLGKELRRSGIAKWFVLTVVPRTTSTDGWLTTANQTVMSGETNRVAYNTWVRANCPIDPTTKAPVAVGTTGALLAGQYGHPITGFFDTAAQVESSLNSGKWLPALRVATGSATASSNSITSSTANFQSAIQESGGDLGAECMLAGAGAAGANLAVSVAVVDSTTQIHTTTNAGTTVTNAVLGIGLATADGVHPTARGHYLMSQAINAALL